MKCKFRNVRQWYKHETNILLPESKNEAEWDYFWYLETFDTLVSTSFRFHRLITYSTIDLFQLSSTHYKIVQNASPVVVYNKNPLYVHN